MQRSGLAHLISISGLHMTLVAGTLFLALRYGLALIPPLALRWPVKKWAAVGGILGASGYLLISGASIPTQRSWIMVVIGFLAILADRNPMSLRLLAVAAALVLLLRPDSLLGASFQLSFAAVLALVAAYEAGAGRLVPRADEGLLNKLGPLAYVAGVCLTTVIASTATAPLTAWHFHSIATYGVLANLIAVPLTSFLIMPVGMLAMALMPFGLDGPFSRLMAWGVDLVLATAHWVAIQPGAAVSLPPMPAATLPLFAMGGLWLCLWQGRGRLLGLLPIALSVGLAGFARGPDLLVDRTFGMAALRMEDGSVRLLQRDRDGFVLQGWQRAFGVEGTEPFPAVYAGAADGLACDPGGCVLSRNGRKLALAWAADTVAEDCRLADLVIAAVGPEQCDGPATLVGRWALWRSGGIAVRLDGGTIIMETVAERRGAWPWVR
jgi:competence protein ComEC